MSAPAPSRPVFPWRLFTFVFLGWAFDFYDLVLLGFLKKPVAADLHLSGDAMPWLVGVALGTSGLGGIAAGWLADRYGKRNVLSLTILVYSIGTLIAGLAPSLEWFFLGRAITGFGVGGEWAIGHGLLAEAVPADRRGRASAALQAGEPIGVALAVIAGFVLVPAVGWRAVMIGSSLTGALAFVVRRARDLPNIPETYRPTLRDLHRARIWSRFLRGWVLGICKLGTYWTCYTWLPEFLESDMKLGIGKSLAFIMTAQGGQLVGMLTFGQVADRLGRRPAFAIYSFVTAIAIALLAFDWQALTAEPFWFFTVMFVFGLGSGCTAGFGALLAELYPREVRSTAMGATYNLSRSVQLIAPVVVGWAVADGGGLSAGLTVPLVLAIATGTWVWTLPETRGIALTQLQAERPPDG